MPRLILLPFVLLLCCFAAPPSVLPQTRMVEVQKGVDLEVLDWGGTGRPLVFLSGFGGTAHSFDGFAQQFTKNHHVYAITRRGFGRSGKPASIGENYAPQRLAADVMMVIRKLGIKHPVIVGHSVAGQELSEIGTHFRKEVSGLIYLEAANSQAFYGPHSTVYYPIAAEVRRDLERLIAVQPSEARLLVKKLKAEIPRLEKGVEWYGKALDGEPDRAADVQTSFTMAVQTAVVNGSRIYGTIDVPILSIVAVPPECEPECTSDASKVRAAEAAAQADDFAQGNPSATVVRLPYAGHFIWNTNGKDVEREMIAFLDKIGQ